MTPKTVTTTTRFLLCTTLAAIIGACQPLDSTASSSNPASDSTENESAISGNNAAGENLGGANLGGANLGGANLAGANLGGANLGGTNLGGANLGGANLGGTNLGGANLGGNNLAGTNLGGANLAGSNLAGANLGGVNLAGSNLSGSNLAGANLAGADLSGTSLVGADLNTVGAGKDIHLLNDTRSTITATGTWTAANDVKAFNGAYKYASASASLKIPFNGIQATVVATKCSNCGVMRVTLDGAQVALVDLYASAPSYRLDVYTTPILAKQTHTIVLEWTGTKSPAATGTRVTFDGLRLDRGGTKMLRSGEDLAHVDQRADPTNGSCVVMGLGSTAFSRLVTANTGSQMFALIDKLPWGFTDVAGGAQQLAAWEAIVWGSNSYCVFIIPASNRTTFDGVGGFVKAVFRWNAPPSQTIAIGKLGGGQSPFIYSGMMNTASRFANGSLSETNLIAGLLSFVTATTNNRSVNVDFASYIQLKDGTFAALGNPTVVTGTTQYDEAVYATTLDADGSYHVVSLAPKAGAYYDAIVQAYDRFALGLSQQPVPKRCLGAKHLKNVRGVQVPSGKCDDGLEFRDFANMSSNVALDWMQLAGAVSNWLTSNLVVTQNINFNGVPQPVLGGTHVYLNEVPYE